MNWFQPASEHLQNCVWGRLTIPFQIPSSPFQQIAFQTILARKDVFRWVAKTCVSKSGTEDCSDLYISFVFFAPHVNVFHWDQSWVLHSLLHVIGLLVRL